MSIESRKYQYGKVFDHWQIKESLGSGSGGKSAVFRLEHTESAGVESALKVISLIEERGRIDALTPERRNEYEKARQDCWERAEKEVRLMNTLQGNTNIVDYQDHTFVDWSDEIGFGRDMLIRMEMLSDLRSRISTGQYFDRNEILKIGRDISTALILCHKKGILHRDIKPENIFFNKNGSYKLGDFGISRIINTTSSAAASTGIGTPQYWAPEQTSGKYDVRVDIYSLGLVLYELANRNRLPFAASSYVRDEEIHRRLLGEPLPAPCKADDALAQVILKACAFRPEDRYQTAEDFLRALNALTGSVSMGGNYTTRPALGDDTPSPTSPTPKDPSNWKKYLPWIITILAVVFAVSLLWKPDAEEDEDRTETITAAASQAAEAVPETAQTESVKETGGTDIFTTEASFTEPSSAEPDHSLAVPSYGMIAAGNYHSVYLNADGTVWAVGSDEPSKYANKGTRLDVYSWTDIVAISASSHTVGLKSDGTVVACGVNKYGQCNVSGWNDVVAVSAGNNHTVGLRSDGTVVAVGNNEYGQCNVSGWRDIIAVAASEETTYGLRSNGTIISAGRKNYGYTWKNIQAICAGPYDLVGLKSDGTVVSTGSSDSWDNNTSYWTDIVAISAGSGHIVGLRSDGTVVACGSENADKGQCEVDDWYGIVQISAGMYHTLGLKSDGTIVAVGSNGYRQLDIAN